MFCSMTKSFSLALGKVCFTQSHTALFQNKKLLKLVLQGTKRRTNAGYTCSSETSLQPFFTLDLRKCPFKEPHNLVFPTVNKPPSAILWWNFNRAYLPG